jgi:hypothetical protein
MKSSCKEKRVLCVYSIFSVNKDMYSTGGSSDFGTLIYSTSNWFELGKNSKIKLKIRFSLFFAISCENGLFGSKKVRSSLSLKNRFFGSNVWWEPDTKVKSPFWNQHKISDFWYQYWPIARKKNFQTLFSGFRKFWAPRMQCSKETTKN